MSDHYNAKAERERKEQMTPERILRLAKMHREFRVSLRYRDDWLRKRCGQLKRDGLLVGGSRHDRELVFYPAPQPSPQVAGGDTK